MVDIQKQEQQKLISTSADDPMVGRVFADKYRIVAKWASGGLSDVYKACDLSDARTVAIKVLRVRQESTRVDFQIFRANARSTIQHPNLVTTIATGVSEEGEPWLALEWLEGETLLQLLSKEGTLPVETVKSIFQQITNALSYAHSQGEVHMNLKPSNIMLVDRDGELFVKICDFGYTKLLMERELEMADERAPARGSTLYMSPEQFKGTLLDSRSDIYSAGCMLYECLVGRPPHQGADMLETMDRHMNGVVVFPSEPEVAEPVQVVLTRMLEKDSTRRQRSMADVLTALEGALQGQFPQPEYRPEPVIFADERAVDFITAKRGTARSKGNEPWLLLMGCVTILLFVLIFQQCMMMVAETRNHQRGKHVRHD